MSIEQITTHVADAQAELKGQHRDDPILLALVGIFAGRFQLLENLFWALLTELAIDTAGGVQLDRLGADLGLARLGTSDDDDYRRLLKVRVRVNHGNAGVGDIIWISHQLAGVDVKYSQLGVAAYLLEWMRATPNDDAYLARAAELIELATATGVAYVAVETTDDGFTFDDGPGFDEGELGKVAGIAP